MLDIPEQVDFWCGSFFFGLRAWGVPCRKARRLGPVVIEITVHAWA